jgi:hypothetical protein
MANVNDKPWRTRRPEGAVDPYDVNAQHGQNRAGVELADGEDFDEYESSHPIDPRAADERLEDEGPEIRGRMHDLGHDVVAQDDDDEGDKDGGGDRGVRG